MPANVPEGGIWLSTRPADMRKSFDGLVALVRSELGGDVVSGGWFVFADLRRTMMKILGFGPGGCWIRAGGPRPFLRAPARHIRPFRAQEVPFRLRRGASDPGGAKAS
ncbi:MAG: IS66 family insertion sequence element accessory protein TnpB [Albidovulum sp.]|nr:IS66 family insertion sequence element accessory protein TnpB [Albidovulum sp.]